MTQYLEYAKKIFDGSKQIYKDVKSKDFGALLGTILAGTEGVKMLRKKGSKNSSKSSRRSQRALIRPPRNAVSAPVTKGTVSRSKRASVMSAERGVRIRHTELIGELKCYDDFLVRKSLSLNPGDPTTFPWLSMISSKFEMYQFNSISIRFINSCSTAQDGMVTIVCDLDPVDAPPTDMVQAQSNKYYTSGPVWTPNSLTVPGSSMDMFTKNHFVRMGDVATDAELRQCDVGTLHMCVHGGTVDKIVGTIEISYDVTLKEFQHDILSWEEANFARVFSNACTIDNIFSIWPVQPLIQGGLPFNAYGNSLDFYAVGAYFVSFYLEGVGLTVTPMAFTPGAATTVTSYGAPTPNAAATKSQFGILVTATKNDDPVQCTVVCDASNATTGWTSISKVDVIITRFARSRDDALGSLCV